MSLITGMVSYYNEIGVVLQQWADIGIFSYVLPFLLIFAVIIAILDQLALFKENRGVSALIALSIALLSLQFDLVPQFFSIIFPKLGVGIAVLLVSLVLMGVFLTHSTTQTWGNYVFFAIAAIIFLAVVFLSFQDYRWLDSWWWRQYNAALIAGLALLIIVIIAMTVPRGGGSGGGRHGLTLYPENR